MRSLCEIIAVLETAERQGHEPDVPEGSLYVLLSDTLVKEIVADLVVIADEVEPLPPCSGHVWRATSHDDAGDPMFRRNSQLWEGERTHVRCINCRARTWMTNVDWEALGMEDAL